LQPKRNLSAKRQGKKYEKPGDEFEVIGDGKERGGKKYYPLSAGGRFNLTAAPKL
jgi:hypothetical protein